MGSEVRSEIIERITRYGAERLTGGQARLFAPFVESYYGRTDPEDLESRRVADLYGMAMSHLGFGRNRRAGEALLRAFAPDIDEHGFASPHSVVELVVEDMPFLVDSMSMELSRHGCGLHLAIHPVIRVRRGAAGELEEVLSPEAADDSLLESYLHIEIDRQTDSAALDEIRCDLLRVVADVRDAVEDWSSIQSRARALAAELAEPAGPISQEERLEAAELLRWLTEGNFIFLGYREYDLVDNGEELRTVPGSGLGILRETGNQPVSHKFAQLAPDIRRKAREPSLLNLTKANSRSTVHRSSYLDYIGVKRFGEHGEVVSERRFLGLYTTSVYKQWPQDIPILRRKVATVIDRAGYAPTSHSGKALIEILDTYPRDELFQIGADELFEQSMAILGLQDRQRLRLLVRRDDFGRFVSCLVYLPKSRLSAALEERVKGILLRAFRGVHLEYTTRVTEAVLARLHLVIYGADSVIPDFDVADLEAQLADTMRSWGDELYEALVEELGEERAVAMYRLYGEAFPASYTHDFPARNAVSDLRRIENLPGSGGFDVNLYRPLESPPGMLRLKLYRAGQPITLSEVLPLLENMGLQVVDERPYEIRTAEAMPLWIYDFGLRSANPADVASDGVRDRFHEAFSEIWRGTAESDGFNRLVLRAGMRERDVLVLRAYARYLRQAGTAFSLEYVATTLANNPELARMLVEIFYARLDPAFNGGEDRILSLKRLVVAFETGLDGVVNLNEDQVLRRLLGTIQASLRTNFFQRGQDGGPKPSLSVKLDPALVPDLPLPRPMFETFVYAPEMEGVHLRGGRVARGGVRWSDRLEDFRTEILGLMKAQTVKNAVIVPAGAKGGFVVKAALSAEPDTRYAQGVACYKTFVRGLLDITDNLVGGEIVQPLDVVRHDGDDPYLVVAADKGTATFSDLANAISNDYGFWLGDAFASGGSSGYDHKAMGITARGAWVSVRRHFRDLGIDADGDELTTVGIGDMSGDVFGNGMLRARHLRLVAAFDHRHIFLDPDPDPEASFAERARLFALARSSWADYDSAIISPGGGVFARSAKRVPLTPQVRQVLDVADESLQPDALIRAILTAPVDLLWNGGIGTYVKAAHETNAEVGDKANDIVRVNGGDLRARVVGEGGNLGLTQAGRIEVAMNGGRINTDAIDNSAGVDCSDHEVNIKILLDRVVAAGAMTVLQRNQLLVEMTDEVAEQVLWDNDAQTRALYNASAQAASMVEVHARFLSALERGGHLNRTLEHLPSPEELATRAAVGGGLTMPEFAVLLALAKTSIDQELLASDAPEDPFLSRELEGYFPGPLRERFGAQLHEHPLRREIIATQITNGMVNRGGTTLVFRLFEETGFHAPDIARAHTAAWHMFQMPELWDAIEELDGTVPASTQVELFLVARTLAERANRWLLRNRRHPLDITATVHAFSGGLATLAERIEDLAGAADAEALRATTERYVAAGVGRDLARRVAALPAMFAGLDIVEITASTSRRLAEAAEVYFALGEPLLLDWLRDRISALPRDDRWQALARAALREDLYAARASITIEVLRVGEGAGPNSGAELVRRWLSHMDVSADRCLAALDSISGDGRSDLATLSVALREIRGLVQVSKPGTT
jgi:glutamate dehydrogenase